MAINKLVSPTLLDSCSHIVPSHHNPTNFADLQRRH